MFGLLQSWSSSCNQRYINRTLIELDTTTYEKQEDSSLVQYKRWHSNLYESNWCLGRRYYCIEKVGNKEKIKVHDFDKRTCTYSMWKVGYIIGKNHINSMLPLKHICLLQCNGSFNFMMDVWWRFLFDD